MPSSSNVPPRAHSARHAAAALALYLFTGGNPSPVEAGWARSYDGVSSRDFVRHADGSMAFCGDYGTCAKTDPAGNLVWQTRLSAEDPSFGIYLTDLTATSDGGLVAVGNAGDPFFATTPFLVRIDPVGNVVWSSLIAPSSGSGRLESVAETASGELLAVGTLNETAWLVELGSSGDLRREVAFGPAVGDDRYYFAGVRATADGGVFALGRVTPRARTYGATWVVKLASDRSVEWQRAFSFSSTDASWQRESAVVALSSGGFALSGATERGGKYVAWVVTLDSAGATRLSRLLHPPVPQAGVRALAEVPGGLAVWVTGLGGSTWKDQVLLKIDDSGQELWQWTYSASSTFFFRVQEMFSEPDGSVRAIARNPTRIVSFDPDGVLALDCVAPDAPVLTSTDELPTDQDPNSVTIPVASDLVPFSLVVSDPDLVDHDGCDCPDGLPRTIERLKAVRQDQDVSLSWRADANAAAYNVWTVDDRRQIELARQSTSPPAVGVVGCSATSPAVSNQCLDRDAIPRRASEILYYQVRGLCADSIEGP